MTDDMYVLFQANTTLKGLFEDLLTEYTGFDDISVYTIGWDLIFIFVSVLKRIRTSYSVL